MNDLKGRDLAIIGMACRFPQANSPAQFWANLKAGQESICEVPAGRWPVDRYYDPTPGTPGKSIAKWGGFLDDVPGFDAAFFGISPDEAAVMDPQHRLLLELAYEALESAGYAGGRRRGLRVGVFVGISQSSYEEYTRPLLFSGRPVHPAILPDNLRNLAAGRIAHSLDLNGPSLALDTACSSSLVALHYARLSLQAGECELALVGGINLNLTATAFVAFSSAGALSPSPHLYLFDERSQGVVLGEGGGMILLAPLAQAIQQGDPLLAVVKGSAVNSDGHSHGLITPNPAGQQAVMAAAYRTAGLDPATISYIEAHGTGTRIGDVVEARSLSRFFPAAATPRYVGSVKANIGHLLSGAGMASLIKVVLAFQAGQIPPAINGDQPRAALHLERAGLVVNPAPVEWASEGPRRAGINAFGFGGSNAHVILEEAPKLPAATPLPRPSALWTISAPTEAGLRESAARLARQVRTTAWDGWPALAYSASTARDAFPWRAALTGQANLPARLEAVSAGELAADSWQGEVVATRPPRLAFLLTAAEEFGQQLYQEEPAFRRLYDAIEASPARTQLALSQLLPAWGVIPKLIINLGSEARENHEVLAELLAAGIEVVLELGPPNSSSEPLRRLAAARPQALRFERLFAQPPATLHELYNGLARLWLMGVPLDRTAVEAAWPRQRVPVPTYPFEHMPYWVDTLPESDQPGPAVPAQPAVHPWLHTVTWEVRSNDFSRSGQTAALVLVAAGDNDLSSQLVARWRQDGVLASLIDPAHLAVALKEQAAAPTTLVYLDSPAAREEEEAGVLRLLSVAQVIAGLTAEQRPRSLMVVTTAAHAVTDSETARPGRAMVAALAAALNDELGLPSLALDLDPAGTSEEHLAAIQTEVNWSAGFASGIVAWRQGQPYRRTVGPLPADAYGQHGRPLALHRDGVYLIVGGAGGIGAEISRAVTLDVAPSLILTGRSPEPAALMEKLRWAGARASYSQCDVIDPTQVTALVKRIGAEYGRLDGVIFAAGLIRPGRLVSKSAADFQATLAAKVRGVPLLWEALASAGLTPEFFVTFSSIASVLPGMGGGLSDYVAANAYLDAYARMLPAGMMTSLNCTIWAEAGQGANALILDHLARSGIKGIGSAEGYQLLKEAIALRRPQLVVVNPEALDQEVPPPTEVVPGPQPQASLKRNGQQPSAGAESSIQRLLQELLAGELEKEAADVSLTDSFAGLGLDSLAAIDLVLALEKKGFGRLPATLFFEHNSVEKLARHLAQQQPGEGSPQPCEGSEPSQGLTPQTFPLSPVQLAFYTAYQLRPDEVAYAFLRQTVRGPLQREAMQAAVDLLVGRHPMLRATFALPPGSRQPQQTIRPAAAVTVEWLETAGDVGRLDDEIANRPLDVAAGQLLRVVVAPGPAPAGWYLWLHLHHIAADGWSLNLLAQEFWQLYSDLLKGVKPALPPLSSHFRDYVRLLEKEAAGPTHQAAVDFWRGRLAELPVVKLPYDGPGRPDHGPQQTAHHFALDEALSERLKAKAAAHDLSLFHLLLAIYYQCLHRWTGQERLVVGVAEAGRDYPLADMQRLVGCLADVFPLALTIEPGESTLALAGRLRDQWLEVRQHTRISSAELARLLPRQERADGEVPLLNPATFSFARFPAALPPDAPITILDTLGRTATAATRLGLVGWEFTGRLHFTWNYPATLFSRQRIATFAEEFLTWVEEEVNAKTPGRKEARGVGKSFIERIEEQCGQYPERPAIVVEGRSYSYGEMGLLAGRWSGKVAAAGVTAGSVVAFLGEPSAEAMMALLAVMRLGATWLPLEPEHPPRRLGRQLEQARGTVLLCTPTTAAQAEALHEWVDEVMVMRPDINGPVAPIAPFTGDNTAYIIFTSGSTGQPKGVPIAYRALDGYLRWASQTFAYGPADVVMEATALGFDASLRQCLVPLMNGAAVLPIGRAVARDPAQLLPCLEQAGLTVWSSVPSLWLHLLAYLEKQAGPLLPKLRLVQLGGEALTAGPVRRWYDLFGDQAQLANLYGPTENTINAAYYLLPGRPEASAEAVPIGYPLPGVTLRLVDEAGQAAGPGGAGELLIGGDFLAAGYLGDEELTRQKFITGPDGARYFRSGDLVRLQSRQGRDCLVFVGRNDNQVKVRGHRIELGEIEAALAGHPALSQAAVMTAGEGEEVSLVAFLEPAGPLPSLDELRAYLRHSLPEAMLPHRFQVVERLPLLANGKLDRAALAARPEQGTPLERSGGRTAPAGPVEPIVAELWQEILGVGPVWREDDFFALGGDSLNILQLFMALSERGLSVPSAAELYRHHTLAAQAQVVRQELTGSANLSGLAVSEAGTPFPLSPAQTGFLLTRSFSPPQSTTWSAHFCLDGRLEPALFEQAVQQLIERHAMLRTVCLPTERPPRQKEIIPDRPLPLRYEDIRAEVAGKPEALAAAVARRQAEEHNYLFDLAAWPLIRMRLCRVAEERHIWFIAADHFIGDGLSGWLFGCELLELYDSLVEGHAAELPSLRTTFRDYVTLALNREKGIDPAVASFWRAVFGRPYELPQEWYQPASPAPAEWLHHILELEPAQFNALKNQAAAMGQTAHDVLLALFARQLGRLTGRTDLVVGTALAGRDYTLPDLMHLFGSFATILPVRLWLDPATQMTAIIEAFRQARAHKLAPGQIARLASSGVSVAAVTGLQFFFSFMDFETLRQPHGRHLSINWQQSQAELQPPRIGTDMVLSARALDGRLRLTFTAGTHALDEAGLAVFATGFADELAALMPPAARARISRPPSPAPAETTTLDAVLVAYLPPPAEVEATLADLGIRATAEDVRRLLFPDGRPRLLATAATPLGRTGTICLSRFAGELTNQATLAEVEMAMVMAAEHEANCVSLAGMLPAHTGYGHALLETRANGNRPPLTTGHSLTVVAMVKTVQQALEAAGYSSEETAGLCFAFVGLGSIGGATLMLYLSVATHPERIMLCDLRASGERLRRLAAEMGELGYTGQIELVESGATLPAEVYSADVIIGAVSQPNILAVECLRPGSMVVDDSFPHCFDQKAAVNRMSQQGDVLLVGGGLLDCGPIQHELHLPAGVPAAAGRLLSYLPSAGAPGCQLESLIRAKRPALPLTQGLVTAATARAYWQAAGELGLRPAPLHLGHYRPERTDLTGFRKPVRSKA